MLQWKFVSPLKLQSSCGWWKSTYLLIIFRLYFSKILSINNTIYNCEKSHVEASEMLSDSWNFESLTIGFTLQRAGAQSISSDLLVRLICGRANMCLISSLTVWSLETESSKLFLKIRWALKGLCCILIWGRKIRDGLGVSMLILGFLFLYSSLHLESGFKYN